MQVKAHNQSPKMECNFSSIIVNNTLLPTVSIQPMAVQRGRNVQISGRQTLVGEHCCRCRCSASTNDIKSMNTKGSTGSDSVGASLSATKPLPRSSSNPPVLAVRACAGPSNCNDGLHPAEEIIRTNKQQIANTCGQQNASASGQQNTNISAPQQIANTSGQQNESKCGQQHASASGQQNTNISAHQQIANTSGQSNEINCGQQNASTSGNGIARINRQQSEKPVGKSQSAYKFEQETREASLPRQETTCIEDVESSPNYGAMRNRGEEGSDETYSEIVSRASVHESFSSSTLIESIHFSTNSDGYPELMETDEISNFSESTMSSQPLFERIVSLEVSNCIYSFAY